MCPHCRSAKIKVKNRTGLERLLVLFTGKRKYRCLQCDHRFRGSDKIRPARRQPAGVATRT